MKKFKTTKGNSVYFGDNTPFVIEQYLGEHFLYVAGKQFPLHSDEAKRLIDDNP
jgi:hypothetical protein